jgi:hypothetical protein
LFLVEILAWSLVVWQLRRELSLTGVIWPAAAGLGVAATCIAILPLGIELPHGSASLAFYGTLLIGARSLHRPELAGGANGLRPCDPNVQHTLHPEDSGSAERAVLFGVARGTLMAVPAILVAVAAILGVEYAFFQSTHTLMHHMPLEEKELPEMAAIIHLANHLTHALGSGCVTGETFSPLVVAAEERLQLGVDLASLLAELESQVKEAEPFFALIEAN